MYCQITQRNSDLSSYYNSDYYKNPEGFLDSKRSSNVTYNRTDSRFTQSTCTDQ